MMFRSSLQMMTFAVFALCASGVMAAMPSFYVDPVRGKNENAGTAAAPFQTLAQARDAVRAVNGAMTGDITVYLHGGRYQLTQPLALGPRDSGNNGFAVIYRAVPGEYPLISGGRAITGWTLHDPAKRIWKASAPGLETRQLYVNRLRARRAHAGHELPGAKKTETGYTTTDATLQNLGNQSDIELVFKGAPYTAAWTEKRLGIDHIAGTDIFMKQPGFDRVKDNPWYSGLTTPSDLENAYEFLDEPGEWYLDRPAGEVYYLPRPGENMRTAEVIAPVLEALVQGQGTLDEPLHDVQFRGLTFAYATWLKPNGNEGFPEWQANFGVGGTRTPGNVALKAAHRVRFERCVFTHLGAVGLDFGGGSQDNVVMGCVFTDISGTSVQIGGVDDPVRADERARDTGNTVANCYIHDTPAEYHGGCGIMAGYAADTLITHNEICRTPYSGVSVGWGWGRNSFARDNRFTYNHVYDVMQEQNDGGGFYSLSAQPDSVVAYNYIHDVHGYMAAVYLDEGTCYYDVHDNVLEPYQFVMFINESRPDSIRGNKIHDNYANSFAWNLQGQYTAERNGVLVDDSWPLAAKEIVRNAGLEPAYRDVLTIPAACDLPAAALTGGQAGAWQARYTPISCVLALKQPTGSVTGLVQGVLTLTIKNDSTTEPAVGQVKLTGGPVRNFTLNEPDTLPYDLQPGTKLVMDISVQLEPGRHVFSTRGLGNGSGFCRLSFDVRPSIKRFAAVAGVEQVAALVKDQPPLTIHDLDGKVYATLRFALAGPDLAVFAHLLEERIAPTDPVKSGIDFYGLMPGATKLSQLMIQPPTAAAPAQARRQDGDEALPAPEIRLATQMTEDGYDLSALIPLSLLNIDPNAEEFLLESMMSAYQPRTGKSVYPALFHSTNCFTNFAMYGHFQVE